MKPIDFCYWFNDFVKTINSSRPTVQQWSSVVEIIKPIKRSDYEPAMNVQPSDVITWLKGFIEISNVGAPNEREWKIICNRLNEIDLYKN